MIYSSPSNIFSLLDQVRQRRGMYASDLRGLDLLIGGYYLALDVHGISENAPSMTNHFNSWLYERTGWSTSCGWGRAIEVNVAGADQQFERFFKLVDEYCLLVPTTLWTVELQPQHAPTGRRCTIGMDGRMERPDRVDIIQYHPEPFFHLRFHYGDKMVDDSFLMDTNGSNKTSADHAKQWVWEELQVEPGEWLKS